MTDDDGEMQGCVFESCLTTLDYNWCTSQTNVLSWLCKGLWSFTGCDPSLIRRNSDLSCGGFSPVARVLSAPFPPSSAPSSSSWWNWAPWSCTPDDFPCWRLCWWKKQLFFFSNFSSSHNSNQINHPSIHPSIFHLLPRRSQASQET